MANEATVRVALTIAQAAGVNYQSYPGTYRVNVTGSKGPAPGAFTAAVAPGTDVDLSQLTTPTLCIIRNLDPTNFVEWGIWDGADFFPLGEIGPGEFYLIKLSRNLGKEYGAGTGTIGSTKKLRFRADTAACNVVVEAFEK